MPCGCALLAEKQSAGAHLRHATTSVSTLPSMDFIALNGRFESRSDVFTMVGKSTRISARLTKKAASVQQQLGICFSGAPS
jgi:hypothetical protein